jgi:hypothetical protein
MEPKKQSLIGNGCADTPVAGQWFSIRHMIAAADAHAKMEEFMEAVFSVRSLPRLYNETTSVKPVLTETCV